MVSPAKTLADVAAALKVVKSAATPTLLFTRHILALAVKIVNRSSVIPSVKVLRNIILIFMVMKKNGSSSGGIEWFFTGSCFLNLQIQKLLKTKRKTIP
jgi:hypothetical protein